MQNIESIIYSSLNIFEVEIHFKSSALFKNFLGNLKVSNFLTLVPFDSWCSFAFSYTLKERYTSFLSVFFFLLLEMHLHIPSSCLHLLWSYDFPQTGSSSLNSSLELESELLLSFLTLDDLRSIGSKLGGVVLIVLGVLRSFFSSLLWESVNEPGSFINQFYGVDLKG